MATTKKSKAVWRPAPASPKERPDAPSPPVVSGAPAPLRVVPPPVVPDPEVRERAARRRFTAEYKLQVLRQADQCAGVGELGALIRREGLYSSHLTTWRQQREQGALVALAPKKRGQPAAREGLAWPAIVRLKYAALHRNCESKGEAALTPDASPQPVPPGPVVSPSM